MSLVGFKYYLLVVVLTFFVTGNNQAIAKTKSSKKVQNKHALPSKYILTYNELMRLNFKRRTNYLRKVGKYLSTLKEGYAKSSLLSLIISEAYAASQFRCIGGGVPVPGSQQNCGVSSYAGFSCDNGMEICNPLIFGILPSGQPVCFANATTSRCDSYTSSEQTTFFSDSRFQSAEVRNAYIQFQRDIDSICSGQASIQERASSRDDACRLVRRRTQANRTRNLALESRPSANAGGEGSGELGAGGSDAGVVAPPLEERGPNSSPREITNFNEEQRLRLVQEIRNNGRVAQAMTPVPGLGNVMNDALKLPDGTYVNVTMAEAREIAGSWGCRLPNLSEASQIRRFAQDHGQVFSAESRLPNNTAQRYTNAQWMMNNSEMRRRSTIGRDTFINGHFKWYIENGGGFSFYGFYAPPSCYGSSSTGYCQNGGSGGHGYNYIDYSQSARFICD